MTLPNFLVLGVAKAGTSSLNHYLNQHPDIGMAREKEPAFLLYAGNQRYPYPGFLPRVKTRTIAEYEALFQGTESKAARGEITPTYFAYPMQTICGIREYLSNPKMIVVFRHPVDRGYSNYLMHLREGNEPITDYSAAVQAEASGKLRPNQKQRTYIQRSFYAEHTRAYLAAFPRDRFLFLLYDDLVRTPDVFFRSVWEFLEVPADFQPDTSIRFHVAATPRWIRLNFLLQSSHPMKRRLVHFLPEELRKQVHSQIRAKNQMTPPKLDPALRKTLNEGFREDILVLQDLIDRDLTEWLRDPI
jgi:hypothetical protein